jgi:hypothetical protein
MKLTRKRLKALIKDEKMAVHEYHSLGLHKLEADEYRHKVYLKKVLKHMR